MRCTSASAWYANATTAPYTASLLTSRSATAPTAPSDDGGATQRTSSRLECVATTASASPNWQKSPRPSGSAMRAPRTSTSVPPAAGPERGYAPCAATTSYSKRAPSLVYCCSFSVTPTAATPAPCAGAMQCSSVVRTHAAATGVALKRHHTLPSCAERAEKPLPVTLTNVPPPTGPRAGSSARSATGCTYSKCTPDELKSRPVVLTSSAT
mmetsp:Transcript_12642/g.32316  ORF Transcript_12642/g.32316 Transcript_12642/m.32316 type:complete len:211 (-) Transcript_12642:776-1408(-)